jgi:hypothetical protein
MGLAACAIAQLMKNDLSVRGRREILSDMAIAHFLGFRDRVKRLGYPPIIKRFLRKHYMLELIDSHHSIAIACRGFSSFHFVRTCRA